MRTLNLMIFVAVESNALLIVQLKVFLMDQLKILLTVHLHSLIGQVNVLVAGHMNVFLVELKIVMLVDVKIMTVELNFVKILELNVPIKVSYVKGADPPDNPTTLSSPWDSPGAHVGVQGSRRLHHWLEPKAEGPSAQAQHLTVPFCYSLDAEIAYLHLSPVAGSLPEGVHMEITVDGKVLNILLIAENSHLLEICISALLHQLCTVIPVFGNYQT
ncbi:hypothetical protein H920_08118 [Fukomys damarensis]|uniref:Uncharacterized protein n=1 Tax=Fukomys damarensis TaxID=885580 RepID=A0A091DEA1_FUKDA|nr:hypothetical protein H920_08118 [Fukomys damarensis]